MNADKQIVTRHDLFLVGMPRSGTKLFRDMLNRHPAVAIFPFESHFFPFFNQRFATYGDIASRKRFSKLYADLHQMNFFKKMNSRDLSISESSWFENLQGSEFKDVLRAYFECYAQLTDSHIVGDKTPAYITQAPLLLELFPNAQFIHIVRDPRDYVISMRKAWNQNMTRATQRWKQGIRKFHDDMDKQSAKYLEVKYESLVSEPRQCLERACDYLEIPFDERMLVLEEPTENLGDAKGVLNVVRDNFDKWKTQLSHQEVQTVESIAGALMEELGYDVSYRAGDQDVSAFRMSVARAQDSWHRFKFILREEQSVFAALARMSKMSRFRLPGG
ncbi:MAG: sulfotransferase family protein [Woeseiaceae bacterium]